MANRKLSGVVTSFEEVDNGRLRRFVVQGVFGRCVVSYNILQLHSNRQVFKDRREWDLVCILDGEVLSMIPDPYSSTGWRISRELTPKELDRVEWEFHPSELEKVS